MAGAYYNEIDPYAAQWLRNLIAAGHIAAGDVDERSIVDVRADDLRGYTQCHFFAGIGVWSYALRLAGWPDDEPVWTGSCPCQPFSNSGRAGGFGDSRHLWPNWKGLILERGAHAVFGEQVASADGLAWFDFVCADLEAAGYAIGAVDSCAAGFGAPHIRQRLFFVADADGAERWPLAEGRCDVIDRHDTGRKEATGGLGLDSQIGNLGNAGSSRLEIRPRPKNGRRAIRGERTPAAPPGTVGGFWADARLVYCADERWRPVEPGTSPLAHGAPARVGRLRAYGNCIVAPQAAEFIRAYRELRP